LGLFFPRPARTFLVVAIGLSQIGEFSFILGQAGLSLKMLTANQYSLILAAALISITVNPFMYRLLPVLETALRSIPSFWKQLESSTVIPEIEEDKLKDHVVLIGFGRVGKHLVNVLESLQIPLIVIESDVDQIELLNQRRIPTLYGDASNSEVITHANLKQARALVVTIPDETSATLIVAAARSLNAKLPIISRASTEEGVRYLSKLGAQHIVHLEMEGGLELVHHTLLSLGFPLREVHEYTEAVRRDHYDINLTSQEEHQTLHHLLHAIEGIEISWVEMSPSSDLLGQSLADANIRSRTGASVVAMIRGGHLTPNPKSITIFESGDRIGVIGEQDQIEAARNLISGETGLQAGEDFENHHSPPEEIE
jgi:CPA2 family monovalent cation:H+ antiporter-2